jgi:hypothetical protein
MREEAETRLHTAVRQVSRLLDALLLRLGDCAGVSLSQAREGYARALGVPVADLPGARQFEDRALGLVLPESEDDLRIAMESVTVDFFGRVLPVYRVDLIAAQLRFLRSPLELWLVACGALPAGFILGRCEPGPDRHAWLCDEVRTPGVSPAAVLLQARAIGTVLRKEAVGWLWDRLWRPALADATAGGHPVTGWAQTLRRYVCRLGLDLAERSRRSAQTLFTEAIVDQGLALATEPDPVLVSLPEDHHGRVLGAAHALGDRLPEVRQLAGDLCALHRRLAALLHLNDVADPTTRRFGLLMDFCNRWTDDGPADISLLPVAFAVAADGTLDRTRVFQAACVLSRSAAAEVGAFASLVGCAIGRSRLRDADGQDITGAVWDACHERAQGAFRSQGQLEALPFDAVTEARMLTVMQLAVLKDTPQVRPVLATLESDLTAWAGGLQSRLLDQLHVLPHAAPDCKTYIRGRMRGVRWAQVLPECSALHPARPRELTGEQRE